MPAVGRSPAALMQRRKRAPNNAIAYPATEASPPARSVLAAAPPAAATAREAVVSLFQALNRRDVSSLMLLLEDDVTYENLASPTVLHGRDGVARFYLDALAAVPEHSRFVISDMTDGGERQVGISWHLELDGVVVPLSRGVGLYSVNRQGQLSHVRDSPEHALPMPVLTAVAAPMLRGLGGLLPAATQLGSALQALSALSEGLAHNHATAPHSGRQPLSAPKRTTRITIAAAANAMPPAPSPATTFAAMSMGYVPVSAAGSSSFIDVEGVASSSSRSGGGIRMRALPDPRVDSGVSYPSVDSIDGAADASSSSSSSRSAAGATAAPSAPAGAAAPATSAIHATATAPATTSGASGGTDSSGLHPLLQLPVNTSPDVNLSGLWEKDPAASQAEEYEAMMDVLQLGGLQRLTARLIDGLDINHRADKFEVNFVTVVPFFRVTESSKFGSSSMIMRRDLRMGRQSTIASRITGGVGVDMSWGEPLPGRLREEYILHGDAAAPDACAMHVTSTITMGGRTASALQVYRRSAANKSDFLAAKRAGYGTLEDVLRKQEAKHGKIRQ